MAGRAQRRATQRRAARAAPGAVPRPRRRLAGVERAVLTAFFVSGVAGLMHQVVWAKLLVQLIGATAYAQIAVLAVFMGGLALGAVGFGRWVDRHARPLRAYAFIECAVAGYCLLLPAMLAAATSLYLAAAARVLDSPALTLALRTALAVLVVLPPAVAMGGTLPLLARSLIVRPEETQRHVAGLYSLNSFGAVVGAGLAGFVVLPALGLYAALGVAALLNLIAAALVWPAARREPSAGVVPAAARPPTRSAPPAGAEGAYAATQYRGALVALALSGFAAMGYEVVFTRLIALAFGASTYSFTVMLMAFITGIALGSAIAARLRVQRPLWLLGVAQLAVVASLLAVTPLLGRLAYLVGLLRAALGDGGWGFGWFLAAKAGLCLLVLLLPTTCLGLGFPLVARVQARRPEDLGWRVGSTYAWNTVGNVLGAAVTGAVLIPAVGTLGAFHVNLACNAVAGLLLLAVAHEAAPRLRLAAAGVLAVAVASYTVAGSGWADTVLQAQGHMRLRSGPDPAADAAERAAHPTASFAAWQRAYVVRPESHQPYFFAEDAHASVLAFGLADDLWLSVNGKPDASTFSDLDTQLLLGHAPLFLHPGARSLLVIGYGSGITAGAALRHPVAHADIVEISRGVLAADRLFAGVNHAVLSDPRVHVVEDDGQSFVRAVPDTYDVVISEPSNPWIAGIGSLFTVEFFTAVRDKLNPDGVFTFWFHTYEQSDEAVALVVRTIGAVFPSIVVFADDDFGNAVAVASRRPLEPDFAAMEQRFADPGVHADLARLGLPNLAALLSHQRLSPARFRRLVDDGPLNTVARERLEHLGPRSLYRRDSSFVLERLDPFLAAEPAPTDALLDRYLAYRAARADPVPAADIEAAASYAEAMGGYGDTVAEAIRARRAER
jgi:predicted membrane-bound spermidine synthase